MSTGTYFVVLAVCVSTALISYYLGVLHERSKWNLLIQRGILPTPEQAAALTTRIGDSCQGPVYDYRLDGQGHSL